MVTAGEFTSALLPRILVRGSRAQIADAFGALADLEPISWEDGGIVLAPLAGGRDPREQAVRVAALPLDWEPAPGPTPPLPFPAAVGGGVYRRSSGHAPAPPGLPEIVLAPGEGFGLAEHPTTAMCLEMLADLPDGRVLDAGCGCGTLALVWAGLGRGRVDAVDLDPRAVTQARESVRASGLDGLVAVRRAPLDTLTHEDVHDRVVLANVPHMAHDALLGVGRTPVPTAVLLSGLQPEPMDAVIGEWERRGLHVIRRDSVGRWQAAVLRAA